MSHEATVVREGEFTWVAVCECGHRAEAPNPETAGKRHGVHRSIQDARAALEQAKEN